MSRENKTLKPIKGVVSQGMVKTAQVSRQFLKKLLKNKDESILNNK